MKGTERTIAVEIPSATSAPWTVQLILPIHSTGGWTEHNFIVLIVVNFHYWANHEYPHE